MTDGQCGQSDPCDEHGRCDKRDQRLAAFESFAADVRAELANTQSRMEALRVDNKVKTATYQQLFAVRATLKDIDRRLAERGL